MDAASVYTLLVTQWCPCDEGERPVPRWGRPSVHECYAPRTVATISYTFAGVSVESTTGIRAEVRVVVLGAVLVTGTSFIPF